MGLQDQVPRRDTRLPSIDGSDQASIVTATRMARILFTAEWLSDCKLSEVADGLACCEYISPNYNTHLDLCTE